MTASSETQAPEGKSLPSSFCLAAVAILTAAAGFVVLLCMRAGGGRLHHSGPLVSFELEEKPRSDTKRYKFALLANGLQVVSVSDPASERAAYAMAVQAGSWDDPVKLPGLAHFCEHMLFLGTDSFPDASSYDNFANAYGGEVNAFTEPELTVYYTELSHNGLDGGLDRFGDLFRAPRFNQSFVEKEVHAIDSEHSKNVQDPAWRITSVMHSLANPESPVTHFRTGNLETLYEGPRREGVDPVEALRVWFRAHYCPSRMRLVTYGPEPLEAQVERAQRFFGNISARSEVCQEPVRSHAKPVAWLPDRLGKWVTILGTQAQPFLILYFALPDLSKEYLSQPMKYISHVLEYAGEHSLVTVLRDTLSLITGLSVSLYTSSAFDSLSVQFNLAGRGAQNLDLVMSVFFQYMATLQNQDVDLDLYASIANVTRLAWDWSESSKPSDKVTSLAKNLIHYPPELLLTGDSLIEKPNPGLIAKLLRLFTPENMNTAFVDPMAEEHFGAAEVMTLPHFGVKYTVEDLAARFPDPHDQWNAWLGANGSTLSSEGLLRQLAVRGFADQPSSAMIPIPPRPISGTPAEISTKNMMADKIKPSPGMFEAALFGALPSNLSLPEVEHRALSSGKAQQVGDYDAMSEAWYRRGWITTSPEAKLEVFLRPRLTPDHWEKSASDNLRLSLYSSLLEEEMAPKLYDRTQPGASYKVVVSHQGITLQFDGFPQLLPGLINDTMAEVRRGLPKLNPARYDRLQREYRELLTSHSAMPLTYAIQDRSLLLTPGVHSSEELLAALAEISEDAVASSPSELLFERPLESRALVMGNLGEQAARSAVADVRSGMLDAGASLGGSPVEGEVLFVQPVVDPRRPLELRKQNPRSGDPNDVAVISLLVGVSTVESRVLYGLLGQMLKQLAYNKLRTSMQLGYVVNAGTLLISNVLAVSTAIQGKAIHADHMEAAVEQVYFDVMPNFLRTLSEEDFKSYRNAYRQQLLQPPLGFSEEFTHFWTSVTTNRTCFKLQDEMLGFLEEAVTSKEPLIEAWSRLVFPADSARRKIAVKYFAGSVPERPTEEEAAASWRKFGVPSAGLDVLAQEFGATAVLGRADSEVRSQLVRDGGYFARELHCERSAAANAATAGSGKTASASQRIAHLEARLRKEERENMAATEQAEAEGQRVAGLEAQLREQSDEKSAIAEQAKAESEKSANLEAQLHEQAMERTAAAEQAAAESQKRAALEAQLSEQGKEKTAAAEQAKAASQRMADLEAQVHVLGREKSFAAEEAEAANRRTADMEAQLREQTEDKMAAAEQLEAATERSKVLEAVLFKQAKEKAAAERQADEANQKITELEAQLREAEVEDHRMADEEAQIGERGPENMEAALQVTSEPVAKRPGRWLLRGGGGQGSIVAPG